MNIPDNLRVREGKETLGKGNEQEWAKLEVTKKNQEKCSTMGQPKALNGGLNWKGLGRPLSQPWEGKGGNCRCN